MFSLPVEDCLRKSSLLVLFVGRVSELFDRMAPTRVSRVFDVLHRGTVIFFAGNALFGELRDYSNNLYGK